MAQKTLPLSESHPALAGEWHPTKNGGLTPENVTPGSSKKVWWRCVHGHEWQATVRSRVRGNGCPICAGRSTQSLAISHPALMAEWHPTKNGDLTPQDVTQGSGRKVWWRCAAGHEWQAAVFSRVRGTGCPICAGRSTESLALSHPALAAEWHPTKNGELTPKDVTPGSHKKVWWRCPHGHEWQAQIAQRVHGTGCPICSDKQTLIGFNDLASRYPALVEEWHPTKNGELTPKDVTPGSHRKIWWHCVHGHEWQATVLNRARGRGCPICAGKFTQSLAISHPALMAEWHPTKNGELTPQDVTPGSHRKIWWRCAAGHEWQAAVFIRVRGTGCPICAGRSTESLALSHPALAGEVSTPYHPGRVHAIDGPDSWPENRPGGGNHINIGKER